jgi:hypothetical protein
MTDTTDKALDARIIRANPIAGMDAAPDGRWWMRQTRRASCLLNTSHIRCQFCTN